MTNYIRRSSVLLGVLTWLALCYHGALVQAQEILKVEYYIDSDPGFGKGQNVAITPGMDVTKTFPVDIASLPMGFHNLYVRALVKQHQVQEGDATVTKGGWSLTSVRTFYKESFSAAAILPSVVKGEYFIDTDPGFGNGTNIPFSASQNLSNLTFAFDVTSLPTDFHNLYVRFKDANGNWSMSSVRTFYKERLDQNNTTAPNIVKGEYFIGSDPGFGNGISIAVTPGTDLSALTFTADISNLPAGFHQLYTRFKDANGNWGHTNARSLYKEVFSAKDPLPNLVKAEYFVDTDPGFGKGKNIPVSPNTELSNLTFAVDMTDVSIGNHKLYVRVQDAKGKWSLTSVNDFEVESPQELYVTVGTIEGQLCAGGQVDVPYTVNGSFGSNNVFTAQLSDAAGNFDAPVAIGTLQARDAGTITASIPANTVVGNGYRIRVVASSPAHTSAPNSNNLTIGRVPALSGISGDQATCLGMQEYNVHAETGVTYDWQLSGGGTLTATGNSASITWTTAGSYTITVTPTNDCGAGEARTMVVNVYEGAPVQTPVITASGRWLYASAPPSGATVSGYQWYVNGGAISGANSSSFYVYDNGRYTVKYTNPCGEGPESNGISFSGEKQEQTITFQPIPDKTYGAEPFEVSATASSGLPVSFSIVSGPATVSGSTVTITGAGTVVVRASQAGNDTYNAANPVDNSFIVEPATATVALANLTQTYNGQPRPVTVTTSPAGLAVGITYDGSTTVPVNVGSYTVVAAVTETNYAGTAEGTLLVDKAAQNLTLEAVPAKTYGDAPFEVLASSSSGLPVSLSISSEPAGIASIAGNTISILGTGTVTITAKQEGDNNYQAAADVFTSFVVNKAAQSINFASLPDRTYGDPPFELSATASSGLEVSFSIVSGPATLAGNTLTMTGTGTVTVRAAQAGNENYLAASTVDRSFNVASPEKLPQVITFAALPDKTYGDTPFELTATASSGLPVSYVVVSGPATVDGAILTVTGAGDITVEASQAGNDVYNAASPVTQSFAVAKAGQSIMFAAIEDKTYGDSPVVLSATASSGLPVVFSLASGPATISGNTLTITGAGDVLVLASQAGNDNYLAAPDVQQTITVNKASQVISFAALPDKVVGDLPFDLEATASSNLSVTFSISTEPATGIASLSGNTITLSGAAGTVTVTAAQGGNDNYLAALEVERSFEVKNSCNVVSLTHAGGKGYTASWVEPNVGSTASTFYFEAVYTDAAGNLPKAGYPKLQLDYNLDGDYLDPQDREIVMVEANGADTNVKDGKRYVAQVNNLLPGQYSTRMIVETAAGCSVISSQLNEPLVSDDLLDVSIFANDIVFSNGEPEVNEPITISATIHNTSDFAAENFVVQVYAEDELLFTQTVASLGAQSQRTLQWEYAFSKVQFYPVKIVIDAAGVLTEKNELNNFAIRPVVVGGYNVMGGIAINAEVIPDTGPASSYGYLQGNALYEQVFGNDFDVSGAEVRAQIVETGQMLQTYTDANGSFRIPFVRPGVAGTYSLLIKVTDFTLTGKQTVPFTVTAPVLASGPNLGAGVKSLNCVPAGTTVNEQVVIYNSGSQAVGAFQVRLYDANSTISVTNIAGLEAAASVSIPFSTSFASEGNYQIYAMIDETNQIEEENEADNNISVVGVNVVPDQPDLLVLPYGTGVGTFDLADPNVPAVVMVSFRNRGGVAAGAFNVNVYLGTTLIHTENVMGLEACSQSSGFSFSYAFGAFGTYTLTAVLDEENQIAEALETNNSYTFEFEYPIPQINLAMSKISVVPAEPLRVGDPLTLVADYSNNGHVSIPAGTDFKVGYDLNIAGAANSVMESVTDGVPYGTTKTTSTTISTPSFTDNRLTVRIDADNVVGEASETDNQTSAPLCWDFTIGDCPGGPQFWQRAIYVNDMVGLTVGLYNKGLYQGSGLKTAIYVNGELFHVQETATLSGLGYTCVGATYTFAEPGEYTIKFVADYSGKYAECSENNNELEIKVNVLPHRPDLQILSQHISPTELNPDPDEPVQIMLSFKNTGRMHTGPFQVRGAVDDVTLGDTLQIEGLGAGEETTVALTAPYRSSQVGAHIIRGFVDVLNQVDESNELNNEASRAIIVGEAANLLFTGIDLSSSCPAAGSTLTLTPIVRNEGDLAANGVLRLYFVTALGDTTLIQAKSVAVGPDQSVAVPFEWQVMAGTTAVYAELVNTSPMEFNYFDNALGQSLCPSRLEQVISFNTIPDKTYGDEPFDISATVSSGLEPELSILSGPATIAGTRITVTGAGVVTVRASQSGNEVYSPASAVERSFTVNKATPVVTWAAPAGIAEGTALSTVQLNATASFKGNEVLGTFTYSPPSGTVLPAGNNQELSVAFVPEDASNFDAVPETKVAITVNGAPVLEVTGPAQVNEGALLTLTSSAADVNGDEITYSLEGSVPEGMSIVPETGTVTWTPTEEQSSVTYTITVRATDNGSPSLYIEQRVSITVNEENVAPVLADIGNKEALVGITLAFTVSATDVDLPAQTITYGASPLPRGASFNSTTGDFSWSPANNQTGSYTITFTATDGAETDEETIIITVIKGASNAPPKISSFSPTSGPVGTEVTILGSNFSDATGVFFNGLLAQYSVMDASTISATVPQGATSGRISVETASGSANSKQSFTVTGATPPPPQVSAPTINGFSPSSGPIGTIVSISGTNFTDVTEVAFNGVLAEYSVESASLIRAIVPSGATSGKITVTTPGGTATSKQNFRITVLRTALALEIVGEQHDVSVYPNPFSVKATVSFALEEGGEYTVSLHDAKGALVAVLKEGVAKPKVANNVEIDGSKLAKGLYLVRILTSEGAHVVRLVHEK